MIDFNYSETFVVGTGSFVTEPVSFSFQLLHLYTFAKIKIRIGYTIKTEANNYNSKATADNYTNTGGVVTTPFILKAKTAGVQSCKPSKICP